MPQKGHIRYEPAKIGIFPKKFILFGEKILLFFINNFINKKRGRKINWISIC